MRFLVDTCVLSELRRSDCHPAARRLFDSLLDEHLFISAINFGELQKGVSSLQPGQRRDGLELWLSTLEEAYSDRILPVTKDTARIWGELVARCQRSGHILGAPDGLIASTAIEHGLHLITRNQRDFEPTGILITNPWNQPAS